MFSYFGVFDLTASYHQVAISYDVIDHTGLTFSKEKREAVVDFRLSRNHEMRSFLELETYFRDHIDHHAEKVLPSITKYRRSKAIMPKL